MWQSPCFKVKSIAFFFSDMLSFLSNLEAMVLNLNYLRNGNLDLCEKCFLSLSLLAHELILYFVWPFSDAEDFHNRNIGNIIFG